MTAEYDPTLSTDKDWIRAQIGDRDTTKAVLSDEEIDAINDTQQNRWLAAAECGALVATRSQGVVEKQVDDLRLDFGDNDQNTAYAAHLQRLRVKGAQELLPAQSNFRVL